MNVINAGSSICGNLIKVKVDFYADSLEIGAVNRSERSGKIQTSHFASSHNFYTANVKLIFMINHYALFFLSSISFVKITISNIISQFLGIDYKKKWYYVTSILGRKN